MDNTVDRQHQAPARRRRHVPWSPRAWGEALYLAGGIPIQSVAPLILFGLISATLAARGPRAAVWLMILWLAAGALIFLLTPWLTRINRHRLRTTAGVEIPPQRKWRGLLTVPGVTAVVRSQSTWRQLCYHVLLAPVLAAAAVVAVGTWPASVVCAFSLAYSRSYSADGAARRRLRTTRLSSPSRSSASSGCSPRRGSPAGSGRSTSGPRGRCSGRAARTSLSTGWNS